MSGTRRGIACALLVVLVSCDKGSGPGYSPRVPVTSPTSANSRVIALVGTLSGPDSAWGNDAFEAAQAAVAVLNREIGEDERSFELVTLDDEGDPQTASDLIENVVTTYPTVGIVFSGPPQALPASEDVLAEAGVPALLQTGDLLAQNLLTPHAFQFSPPYTWQADALGRYLFDDRGYTRVGSLTRAGASGQSARRALQSAFAAQGHRLAASELLPETGGGLDRALTRLRKARVQAIVVEGAPRAEDKALAALEDRNAVYVTRTEAKRSGRPFTRRWNPQIAGFDTLIAPQVAHLAAGSVAAESYARGAHYLPIPSFESFRRAFSDWWGNRVGSPLGQERRAFESVLAIGWAARRVPSSSDADLAQVLERLDGKRFGGLDISFSASDRAATEPSTVGLWTVPSAADDIPNDDIPTDLFWVPLDRTFTGRGNHTSVLRPDLPYLFPRA
ncbi:MAG TPA: ABC transporter substrate-binding protein, partial [Actinomycetota bacterium]|nr:ABC transporter substrate-binding protein [Actinomycetota bacterium]